MAFFTGKLAQGVERGLGYSVVMNFVSSSKRSGILYFLIISSHQLIKDLYAD